MKKLYHILLLTKTFNPHGLKSIDHDSKLIYQDKNIELMVYSHKMDNWSVILVSRPRFSEWEEFSYNSHKDLGQFKPSRIKTLLIANQLITKYLQNEH